MWVLGLLPFLFFVAMCWLFSTKKGSAALRDVMITSALLTAGWLVLGTELLSLLQVLSFWPLLAWWVLPSAVLTALCVRTRTGRNEGQETTRVHFRLKAPNDRLLTGIIAACIAILLTTFVVALMTPPNNIDALTYHLPRQVYWMQQKYVGSFPTNDVRMLVMPPFAEYAGLNLMILSGGDRWVNLIQWFAFGLTAITASRIASELQGSARMQATASLLVLTIPTAALQSMNPKNDVVAAFFLCAMALKALDIFKGKSWPSLDCILFGLATGLLLLTKSTALLFGAPLGVWIVVVLIRLYRIPRAFSYASMIAAMSLTINLGHWTRMQQEFRSPLGPPLGKWGASLVNTVHSPKALTSNLLRNCAMHLAIPPWGINSRLLRAVEQFHHFIGFDLNDERTTFTASGPFSIIGGFIDEDRAKAPFHVLLGTAALFAILARAIRREDWAINTFALTAYLGFLLFCYFLTWQEWHSRLHIPILCLLAPLVVYALPARAFPVLLSILAAAFLLSTYSILWNHAKPLIGAHSILTHSRSRLRIIPTETGKGLLAVQEICRQRQPKLIGIYSDHICEYTLLHALMRSNSAEAEFLKINPLWGRRRPGMKPELVIGWYGVPPEASGRFYTNYALISREGPVQIFSRNHSAE